MNPINPYDHDVLPSCLVSCQSVEALTLRGMMLNEPPELLH